MYMHTILLFFELIFVQTTPSTVDENDFGHIPLDTSIPVCDELAKFLVLPCEECRDPLGWWWDHRGTYPHLSKMAFDYLSIPGKFSQYQYHFNTDSFVIASSNLHVC